MSHKISIAEAMRLVQEGGGKDLKRLDTEALRVLAAQVLKAQNEDRRENQIEYYKPVSPQAERVHMSQTRYRGVGGGNGASKTDTLLAEYTMHATGIYPEHLNPEVRAALRKKFRGPVAIRVVVESLINTLYPIILPKLQWWKWNGLSEPGGEKGHWGWIPRRALVNGVWQQSWSDKQRILRTLCFDPENPMEVIGETTWQFMSKDVDPTDFASGDFHWILHDELPTYPIWRENEARTMRVGGHMDVSFTWPDDPAIPVDWIYDQVYEKGLPGPDKSPHHDWFEMWSTDNPNLNQETVKQQEDNWSVEVASVRIRGQPIRFSNRVHPLFTKRDQVWCFKKHTACGGGCDGCVANDFAPYNHVVDFEVSPYLPAIQLIDPHPRKPHYLLWVQIDTWDDLWVYAEELVDGEPDEVREVIAASEKSFRLTPKLRLGDPNMLKSPASVVRGRTWQDEFAAVGLYYDLADNSDVGRGRVNDYLKPDPDRRAPRLHVHPRCTTTIRQMERYVWDDYKHQVDKDQKQMTKQKEDDMPTLLKYLMNFGPTYEMLHHGAQVIRTR